MQYVAVCCSVLQCVLQCIHMIYNTQIGIVRVLQCVAGRCIMLQCVAACVAVYPHHIQYSDVYCACVAVCHSVAM